MDTTTVEVNGTCNAGCAFCELGRRPSLNPGRLNTLREQLRDDRDKGADRLRISGGEPLLERALPQLVQDARSLGYETVLVETNAMVASLGDIAHQLSDAGVTDVLWAVGSSTAEVNDAMFGLSGAHHASVKGAKALVNRGIAVTARTPITTQNIDELSQLPRWLTEEVGQLEGWWLRPLIYGPRSEYDPKLVPDLEAMRVAIEGAARSARKVGLKLSIDDETGLPLCLLRGINDAIAGLRRHPHRDRSQTHVKREACAGCAASSDCPGQPRQYAAIHGAFDVVPFTKPPRALVASKSRPEQQVIYDRTREEGDELRGPQVTIRVIMPCNQDCTFCFVDRTSPSMSDEAIYAAIDKAIDDRASRISLSGGEPTLHRNLEAFVARAARGGVEEVELQTNALLLEDVERVTRLRHAGLNQAVVSLHAVDIKRYQDITKAGTPEQVIAGVRHLLDQGVRVELNVVQNQGNVDHLSEVVEVVSERIPEVELLFSITFIVDGLPRAWESVAVRYSEAVPHLIKAMNLAKEKGVDYRLTGRCGTPPCTWRDNLNYLFDFKLLEVADKPEPGHRYVDACEGCAAKRHCYGVNEAYLAQFGDREFRGITTDTWASEGRTRAPQNTTLRERRPG